MDLVQLLQDDPSMFLFSLSSIAALFFYGVLKSERKTAEEREIDLQRARKVASRWHARYMSERAKRSDEDISVRQVIATMQTSITSLQSSLSDALSKANAAYVEIQANRRQYTQEKTLLAKLIQDLKNELATLRLAYYTLKKELDQALTKILKLERSNSLLKQQMNQIKERPNGSNESNTAADASSDIQP